MEILDDPERILIVSDYLRLEVLPKPIAHRRQDEIDFMSAILESAGEDIKSSSELTKRAIELASRYDMTPIDALHVGVASIADVDEFITMEKPEKPMCRVQETKVISLYSGKNRTR